MISCQTFFNILNSKGLNFFTGIPDSTFKDFMKFLNDKDQKILQNLVACNECEAIALSAGYHLATGNVGVVYMQNSGLGKAVNPLTSLCDPLVFSIPLLLLIGWRGEPGKTDAPQHKKMGKITLSLLDTLEIPYSIIEPDIQKIKEDLYTATEYFTSNQGPYAFVIKRGIFQEYEMEKTPESNYELSREEAIKIIMDTLNGDEIIISSTGYTSREVYEYRETRKKDHFKNFYNIGSMGCASAIGLSIAKQKPDKKIIIFDGDGAALMQMGAFTTIGRYSPKNLIHYIFNNNVHETTGSQPTNSANVNFLDIAIASNYKDGKIVKTRSELIDITSKANNKEGPTIIVVNVRTDTKSDLKRPEREMKEYKEELLNYLK